MDTRQLKSYAPGARQQFIEAVRNKAAQYGLLPDETLPMQRSGDIVTIGGQAFSAALGKQRDELASRVAHEGYDAFIDSVAYTWFNRLIAIRFMEIHGYLEHGYRVLSHPDGGATPEILGNAERVELPGLDRGQVVDLKLDGNKDEELYQLLLIAQCNGLHEAMPFLFEKVHGASELLLPDNLLHTDSLVRTLVSAIPEEQWNQVEIVGWLYQFFISERKDEVIGKVVPSEDIPAATQLFTPNWIVKYMVQNSLGAQWLATYSDSGLKSQMEYYIEPAEQTPEVNAQLAEITPESLDPEQITLIDPAVGSGHILVEAYDVLKAIYLERGYRLQDIPEHILTKNLFGIEIDDRAAQLAAFALLMKARADDHEIFKRHTQPVVIAIQESAEFDPQEVTESLNAPLESDQSTGNIEQVHIAMLIELFEHGKTFGSLIQVPAELASSLADIAARVADVAKDGSLLDSPLAEKFRPIVTQAQLLADQYDNVVANPPYM